MEDTEEAMEQMQNRAGDDLLFCAGSLYLIGELKVQLKERRKDTVIDFEEEKLSVSKPSLDVEAVEDAIVKSDLTDMTDIMMEN